MILGMSWVTASVNPCQLRRSATANTILPQGITIHLFNYGLMATGAMPYYQLFSDPTHRQIWGGDIGGSVTIVGSDNVSLHGGAPIYGVDGHLSNAWHAFLGKNRTLKLVWALTRTEP